MLIVADTSSLVALAAADSLDLLDRLFQEVRVPKAVEIELLVPGKPQATVLQEFLRGKVISIDLARYVTPDQDWGLESWKRWRCTRRWAPILSTTSGRER